MPTSAIVWTCTVQFAFICGVEAVHISVFAGSPQFDSTYNHPGPGILGPLTALYPICAGVGSLITLWLGTRLNLKWILQISTVIWAAGFMLATFYLTLLGMWIGRALKGISIGMITAILAPYVQSTTQTPARILTVFQALVPLSILLTSLVAIALHHLTKRASFNLCWIVAASPALFSPLTTVFLPRASAPEKQALAHQLKQLRDVGKLPSLLKACFIQSGVQMTGINVILYYVGTLCALLGFSHQQSQYVAMGVYGSNFLATLLSVLFITKLSCRMALKYSALVMALAHGLLLVLIKGGDVLEIRLMGTVSVAVIFSFVWVFSLLFNGVSFVHTSELAPAPKSVSIGIAIAVGWFTNAIFSATMPLVMSQIKGLTFMIFNSLCVVLFVAL